MHTRIAGTIAMFVFAGLAGCASMSEDECLVSDWQAIGFEDGSRGYTADRLGNHRKACAKHGVTPDFQAYRAGHSDGLRDYCQPARGFNLGANGSQYNGMCASDLEPAFIDAYRSGQQLHSLRSNVRSATHGIDSRKEELARIEALIRDKEAALISRETTTEDRILILADLKDLSKDVGQLEAEIVELSEDRVIYELELASYEAVLADSGYY
jgi:hypothetical protein